MESQRPKKRLPSHLLRPISPGNSGRLVYKELERLSLHTVCTEALCPNRGECYSHGTATFLLMGPNCTRSCSFCAVGNMAIAGISSDEPGNVAEAAFLLKLSHVVVTSVTRDDLPDGGAGHFALTIRAIRERYKAAEISEPTIEVLVPDFQGEQSALETVFSEEPEIFNHNLETVKELYEKVRPQADYRRSLMVLRRAKEWGLIAKSGIMLGLGEQDEQVVKVLEDILEAGCDYLTIGQYLQPSDRHLPVTRYLSEEEFAGWQEKGEAMGFKKVFSGIFVRSSYMAEQLLKDSRFQGFQGPRVSK